MFHFCTSVPAVFAPLFARQLVLYNQEKDGRCTNCQRHLFHSHSPSARNSARFDTFLLRTCLCNILSFLPLFVSYHPFPSSFLPRSVDHLTLLPHRRSLLTLPLSPSLVLQLLSFSTSPLTHLPLHTSQDLSLLCQLTFASSSSGNTLVLLGAA